MLPRHLFQLGERLVIRAGAKLGAVFDDTVESAVDERDAAFLYRGVAVVEILRRVTNAGHIAHIAADRSLHRLGDGSTAHADRIVQISAHEGEQIGTIIGREWLRAAGAFGESDAAARACAGAQAEGTQQHGCAHGILQIQRCSRLLVRTQPCPRRFAHGREFASR